MKIVTNFKKMRQTESLVGKIEDKSERLQKYFEGNFEIYWTCYLDSNKQHVIDVKLVGKHLEYYAKAKAPNMYQTLDKVVAKIERQIHKKKEKTKSKISHKHSSSLKEQIQEESLKDEAYWEDKKAA